MNDDGFIPPMMPDDFAALAAIAGPLYQESKVIEAFTSENPVPNASRNYGSMNIRRQLEQAQQLVQVARPVQVPPSPIPIPTHYSEPTVTPLPQPIQQPVDEPVSNDQQLELSLFNNNNVTNDLLKEISRKLTKIIGLLENQEREDTIPKLKANVKKNQA